MLITATVNAQQSLHVNLLCNWNDSANLPTNSLNARYSDCWGYTAPNGTEYGIIGSTNGTHIIDLNSCREVSFYPGAFQGSGVVHRDFKTYKHYLYAVCDEGRSTLQVFDLQYLPDSLHLVYESNPADLTRTHDLFIDTAKGRLYCASVHGDTTRSDYMRIYSLADPEHPVLELQFNQFDNIHSLYVSNDTAYLSASFYGLVVVDFSTLPNYRVLGTLTGYPNKGYNHSNWLNNKRVGVMADETHGLPVKIIDAASSGNVRIRSSFSPRPGDSTCIPHNPFVLDHTAFISYYYDGLQILDISDPYNPVRTGYYDTYMGPNRQSFAGAWGTYPYYASRRVIVSDMQSGLYVLDAKQALSLRKTKSPALQLVLQPNPASDRLEIKFPLANGSDISWEIQDMTGQSNLHGSARLANGVLVLPLPARLPAGIYLLKGFAASQPFTLRFTKL